MITIGVGYDPNETEAFYTLVHSIHTRSSMPVSIIPIHNNCAPGIYKRPRGEFDSTEFSNARWVLPYLCGFKGWAIFMDCDILCQDDIAKLWAQRDSNFAVQVVGHNHIPIGDRKFLGSTQSTYDRKNHSSVMLFNCSECRALSPEYINTANGLELHQFDWLPEALIGDLPDMWNHLVGGETTPYGLTQSEDRSLTHWTKGGPWFNEYADEEFADEYRQERHRMISGHSER